MKKTFGIFALLMVMFAAFALAGCGSNSAPSQSGQSGKKIVVGFSQVGAESEWRTAVTKSIKDEFAKTQNMELLFSDGQQKQENQMKAIRTFIQQKVDIIVLAPVVETGWDAVLAEAKDAKIPVIVINRALKMSKGNPEDYIITLIAPDNIEGGRKAAKYLVDYFKDRKDPINTVVLEGTVGSAPAMDRKLGFEEVMKDQPNFNILKSQSGDFTRSKGKEVMESFLKSTKASGQKIDALYCHNDDMAIGAIQAIEEAGLKPGKDIIIASNDGVKGAFEAMIAGKMNATVENPPGYGAIVIKTVNDYFAKKPIEKWIKLDNKLFPQDVAAKEMPNRTY